jgi:hypothetical protein
MRNSKGVKYMEDARPRIHIFKGNSCTKEEGFGGGKGESGGAETSWVFGRMSMSG